MARGRTPGFLMSEEHRLKIKNSNILNALVEHIEGRRDMSSTQVSAGLGLLKKVMPDLAAVEHSGEMDHNLAVTVIENEIVGTQADNEDSGSVPPVTEAGTV